MLSYYPPITPYREHQFSVDAPHCIFVEECGNPDGLPILFVHGGPGGGCSVDHRRFFDPAIYRIILFDQRGCGRSTPHAELNKNTTQALIADMELIRHQLNIPQWILFGGSWGSTLSLVYAQTHPDRVLGLILRGIFLSREVDFNWFYREGGMSRIFPDYWEDFVKLIPKAERDDLIGAYYKRLTSADETIRLEAAQAWALCEARSATLKQQPRLVELFTDPYAAISIASIECHYFINRCFLTPNQILLNMPALAHIPGIIIHGRYDMLCTFDNAWTLHRAWPQSQLVTVDDAGHAASEAGITDALIRATQHFATTLG